MAAGQKKRRRLNGASVESCNLLEQHGGKKKKSGGFSQNAVNLKPHISLEWDEVQKKAVARKEQVGITRRDISSFVGSLHQVCTGLADVITIPREIFALDDLNGVLSYEVWQTCLSESERKHLLQFLPGGMDVDQVVKPLLMGKNLHFGNPLLKWGSSLCSGNLHPDAVLHKETCFKANKKAYYSELQKYHNDILENLQIWKKRWTSCKDPEKDIVQKLWRYSRKRAENSLSSYANESRQLDREEHLAGSADSCSSIGDEKGSSSKKENILDQMYEQYQERKGSRKHKLIASISAEADSSTRKADKPRKRCWNRGDPAKYMSCIKISRRQHQLVRNIKQCSNGIRFKSLNHVLGDTKELDIQTYGAFEEEERRKLHEHWLQLVRRDLPAAFIDRKEMQMQVQHWRKSIEHEIAEKKKPIVDEDEEADLDNSLPDPGDNEEDAEILPTATTGAHDHHGNEILPTATIRSHNCEDYDSVPHSTPHQPLLRVPSLNSRHEPGPVSPESGTNRESLEESHTATKEILKEEPRVSSARDIWPAATESFYHPNGAGPAYRSPSELSLRQPEPVKERAGHLIDLETNILEQPAIDEGPLFCYANQDHDQLVEPFLKGQQVLQPYSQDFNGLKQQELQFLTMNRDPPVTSQLSQHFHEQRLLEERRMREKEVYMNQNLQKNMHGNEKYSSQELFLPAHVPDWAAGDSLRLPPFHAPGTGELLGHQWFPSENRGRAGWPCVDGSGNPGLADGSNTDSTLFCELNRLPPRPLFDTVGSDPYFPVRGMSSGSISGDGGVHCRPDAMQYVYPNHQLNYLSQPESTAAAFKVNSTAWMNVPLERMHHQISGLHDPGMKPFLRSWNQ